MLISSFGDIEKVLNMEVILREANESARPV
jgi:hypothetical protein